MYPSLRENAIILDCRGCRNMNLHYSAETKKNNDRLRSVFCGEGTGRVGMEIFSLFRI